MYKYRKPIIIIAVLLLIVFIFDRIFPLPKERLFPEKSTIVYYKGGKLARIYLTHDDKVRIFTPYKNIPKKIIGIFLISEDRYFFYHFGVNPLSIIRALINNLKAKKIVSGGSTITMQIARMIEPKNRNILSKIIEATRAIQLELHYSKKKLMEIYLNITPYGSNIEGIGAASYIYFGKPITALNSQEIALLTIIPKNPNLLNLKRGNKNRVFRYYGKLLKKLKSKKILNREDYLRGLKIKGFPVKKSLPFDIPHYSDFLKTKFPKTKKILTTIDYNIQKGVEKIVKNHYQSIKNLGVRNLAVVVINNREKSFEAIIGSQDYFDKNGGQIKGFLSRRSPGSTLKPFLYALAIENGLLNTETLLKDIPIEFKAYAPKNYKDIYRGLVPTKSALSQSLNVPAVNLLKEVGLEKFYKFLRRLKFDSLKSFDNYGLSIILGGCGINLLELTRAYSVFPLGGKLYDIKYIKGEKNLRARKIYSPGTVYLISEILSEHRRPDFPESWKYIENIPIIAWKTGTSYGHFDAWSIGFNPDYTIGVWSGNFNNESSADIIGAKIATPLLFEIFNSLKNRGRGEKWFKRPGDLIKIDVCRYSGMLPIEGEKNLKQVYVLKNRVPRKKCPYHKKYFIDKRSGKIVCPSIMKDDGIYEERIFRVFPPDIAFWYQKRGILLEKLPERDKRCGNISDYKIAKILFPENKQVFIFPGNISIEKRKIPLKSDMSVYWFIDNRFIGKGFKMFYSAKQGIHKIEIIDENGNQGKPIRINIKIFGKDDIILRQ